MMAPVTRLQAAKLAGLVRQRRRENVGATNSSTTALDGPVPPRAIITGEDSNSDDDARFISLQESILKRALRGPAIYLANDVCKRRIDCGLTKSQLLERIEEVLEEYSYGNLRWQRRLRSIQKAFVAATVQIKSNHPVMSPGEVTKRLRLAVYEIMKLTHQVSSRPQTSSSQARVQACFPTRMDSGPMAQEPHRQQPHVSEQEMADRRPQLLLNEREKVVKLAFSPDSGRNVSVEFALLEVLGTLGKESLDDLVYEDYVRVIQIIKQDKLARIRLEIEWDPMEEIGANVADLCGAASIIF